MYPLHAPEIYTDGTRQYVSHSDVMPGLPFCLSVCRVSTVLQLSCLNRCSEMSDELNVFGPAAQTKDATWAQTKAHIYICEAKCQSL